MRIDLIVFALWGAWVVTHLIIFALGVLYIAPQNTAHFNGFRIVVPPRLREFLPDDEYRAMIEHEEGHQRHWHVWYNLLRVCFLNPISREEIWEQEIQADDGVTDQLALARALKRMGAYTEFDLFRVRRLEYRGKQRLQDAGTPTPGMGEYSQGRGR